MELHHDAEPELGGVGDPVQPRIVLRPGEGSAGEVAVLGGEREEVLHERGGEVVPGEDLERGGHHEAGRLRQPLEQGKDAGADVAPVQSGTARRGARQDVEVAGLGVGEPQRAGDSGQYVTRRPWCPALFESDVVLRGDMREDRHFLAAKTWRPASRAGREADVLRAQPLAAAAQERPEFLLVHAPSMRTSRRRILVQPVPESGRDPVE